MSEDELQQHAQWVAACGSGASQQLARAYFDRGARVKVQDAEIAALRQRVAELERELAGSAEGGKLSSRFRHRP